MNVFIQGGSVEYRTLFESLGFTITKEADSDLIVFTGGSDVNPILYGQSLHPYSRISISRDEDDIKCYLRNLHKPKVGICRGGQFLHVMNGGTLYQDVDNHAIRGTHKLLCKATGAEWEVTSTHHQMMCPDAGEVMGLAGETSYAESSINFNTVRESLSYDVEVVFHPKAMCFQPHPEFYGADSTRECFTHFLNMFLEK